MEEYAEPAIDLVIPKRAQLAELLCYQPKKPSDEEMLQRRIEVVDLYVALSGKRETVKRNHTRPRSQVELPIKTGATRVKPTLKSELEPHPDNDDHHLERKERAEQQGGPIVCRHPQCSEVKLRSVDEFRNHIKSIHGVTLRSSVQVQERRTRKAKLRRPRYTGRSVTSFTGPKSARRRVFGA
ncbi:hypothetical protein F4814DRAFT_356432 [Daldinia grandis]|nr:hypothetical protein F4814DRAFT_356432 [Daldinia grandis]